MNIIHVTEFHDAGLQPYRTLRRPVDHQRAGIFVAEGEKVVRRLFESRLTIHSVLITPEWLEVYRLLLEKRQADLTVYVAPKELLESIVGFHLHQGIMAVGAIPGPEPLEEILQRTRRPRLLVAIDGLTNAENLGVLVRNCAAFGVEALIVGETSSSPYLRRSVRNSMGTIFRLPVVHVDNLIETLTTLRTAHQMLVLAAHPHAEGQTLAGSSFSGDCCVVFGSEGEGIAPRVLQACDDHFAIPMEAGVDSLNVASATAVVLYEVSRQRGNAARGDGGNDAATMLRG